MVKNNAQENINKYNLSFLTAEIILCRYDAVQCVEQCHFFSLDPKGLKEGFVIFQADKTKIQGVEMKKWQKENVGILQIIGHIVSVKVKHLLTRILTNSCSNSSNNKFVLLPVP